MTIAVSRKTCLDVIMISHCQGDDTFVAFQAIGIFRFWRNREFTFSKQIRLQPLYFSWSPAPAQSSLPFCACVQFSRSLVQWSNKNTRKLRAVNSLIWNPALAYGSVNSNPTPKEQKCFWLWREQVWHISWTCIVHIYCVAQLVDSVELSSTVCCFRSRYYRYVFVRFLFTDCCSFTLRKLDI